MHNIYEPWIIGCTFNSREEFDEWHAKLETEADWLEGFKFWPDYEPISDDDRIRILEKADHDYLVTADEGDGWDEIPRTFPADVTFEIDAEDAPFQPLRIAVEDLAELVEDFDEDVERCIEAGGAWVNHEDYGNEYYLMTSDEVDELGKAFVDGSMGRICLAWWRQEFEAYSQYFDADDLREALRLKNETEAV